jgi:hypothetical protein
LGGPVAAGAVVPTFRKGKNMSMQAVSPTELQCIQGGFNLGAAVFVGLMATVDSGGNPVVGVAAGLLAGFLA